MFIHKEKHRGCLLLGANKYTHIYIKYIIYLFLFVTRITINFKIDLFVKIVFEFTVVNDNETLFQKDIHDDDVLYKYKCIATNVLL